MNLELIKSYQLFSYSRANKYLTFLPHMEFHTMDQWGKYECPLHHNRDFHITMYMFKDTNYLCADGLEYSKIF